MLSRDLLVVPQKLKIELPYDPAIPLLGVFSKEIKSLSWRDICTSMFIAALFTAEKCAREIWRSAP
ncbi:unnamed protein product [Nyctereutes procyonoides]|uniref:(raccoon dog) hypothetical protein n=1 Tax=Nyctereutes procyonoides TaxID=34880 RepID=A0A811YG32_NYCPR|nr:unnamed protein product [Nyctereutes procyonoides]